MRRSDDEAQTVGEEVEFVVVAVVDVGEEGGVVEEAQGVGEANGAAGKRGTRSSGADPGPEVAEGAFMAGEEGGLVGGLGEVGGEGEVFLAGGLEAAAEGRGSTE